MDAVKRIIKYMSCSGRAVAFTMVLDVQDCGGFEGWGIDEREIECEYGSELFHKGRGIINRNAVVVEHFRRVSFRLGRAVRAIDAAAPRSLAALRSLYPKYSPPSRVPLFTHAPRHYVQHSVSIEATE